MITEYRYMSATGAHLGSIFRNDTGDGEKTFRASKGFPNPSPLYGLDRLAARPHAPVIVVEGEKTADAGERLFPDYVTVTSPFGSNGVNRADWSALADRDVTLWPDNDQPGREWTKTMVKLVPHAKVVIPAAFPANGWDIADEPPVGITTADMLATIRGATVPPNLKVLQFPKSPKGNSKANCSADLQRSVAKILSPEERAAAAAEMDAALAAAEAAQMDQLKASAAEIIASSDVLALFEKDWRLLVAGEVANAKLLYLVATSRLFRKAMHAAIKGPSAAGKSEIRKRVLSFFPDESVVSFTTLSEKSLLYFDQDFCHLILSMGEAAGAEEQQLQDYLLRELMSEGKLRYPVVTKTKEGLHTVIIEKNGPVCFLVTTTQAALHAENETRMLSLEIDDSTEQTVLVLAKVAEVVGLNATETSVAFTPWHDFQRWLGAGNCNVVVPFAQQLGQLIPPRSVRLRRDFAQVLLATKAHALLHRAHRKEDDHGQIVADIDLDYVPVARLMGGLVAEASGTGIAKEVQETINAVRVASTNLPADDGATAFEVAKLLKLDKSSAWRRLRVAVDKEFVTNLETRRRQPGRYRLTDQEIKAEPLLPSGEILSGAMQSVQSCNRTQKDEGKQDDNRLRADCMTPPFETQSVASTANTEPIACKRDPHAIGHAIANHYEIVEEMPSDCTIAPIASPQVEISLSTPVCVQCGDAGGVNPQPWDVDGVAVHLHAGCESDWLEDHGAGRAAEEDYPELPAFLDRRGEVNPNSEEKEC
jgi:5S rRNA maturation endonuclease (ribonuclease M5)